MYFDPNKVVFNTIPTPARPFSMHKFDHELNLSDIKLSYRIIENITFRSAQIGIDLNGVHEPIAEVKLYHSGNLYNYEQTFASAEILVKEIVKRFNEHTPRGQQCLGL